MAKNLKIKPNTEVAKPFVWLGRDGKYEPEKMGTVHLFNTISMIWNHSMPVEFHTHKFREYSFGPNHTNGYMMQAVRVMLPILLNRKDLTAFQHGRLAYMHSCLQRNPKLGYKKDPSNEQSQRPCNNRLAFF